MAHYVSFVVGVVNEAASAVVARVGALVGVDSCGRFIQIKSFRLITNR